MDIHTTTNIMSLCSGVGGIELGLKLVIPDARTVMYCEREMYACEILVKRMEEKLLDEAPIWSDLTTFDGEPWRGKVDIITAGFPCQPWSCAGKGKGTEDERWIWPDIARIIGEVRPAHVFLENVPGLVSGGGFLEVLGDLAKIGYDAEWMHLSAADVGANHKRERVWILAHSNTGRESQQERSITEVGGWIGNSGEDVANAPGARNGTPEDGKPESKGTQRAAGGCGCVEGDVENPRHRSGGNIWTLEERNNSQGKRPADNSEINGSSWWAVEPGMGRVVNGLPFRVDRLRACGNGVVPLVAAVAYILLRFRIGGS